MLIYPENIDIKQSSYHLLRNKAMSLPTHQQIVSFLRRGKNNPTTAKEIAVHFSVSDNGTEVPVRKVIRQAIKKGELIGSCNKGFFLIDTKKEFDKYLKSLHSRKIEISDRISNLQNNWEKRENG